jgi:hypothetical protein
LNSVIFALELMIIEPDESRCNLSSLELYKREEIFTLAANRKVYFDPKYSPKIVNIDNNSGIFKNKIPVNIFNTGNNLNKKRKFSQFDESLIKYDSNKSDTVLKTLYYEVKRFKYLTINENNDEIMN